ncbi:MAG TPA: hypothetical protein VGQ20_13145 [Acidimicrobiales bacterium]|jgi:hypothetical protein|nr:hypothetical protein [Acidimicrobiales bacterium]
MARIRLVEVCGARSGDKGDISDVTLFADERAVYVALVDAVTTEKVAAHFGSLVRGPVERYPVPNLLALKFVLHGALGGGSGMSLRSDEQGKTHGLSLLRLEVDLPDDVVASARRRPRAPLPSGAKPWPHPSAPTIITGGPDHAS